MDKRIKGITIEIGGDTVGLDKALKDVNKQSSNLQSELSAVQRLLKFDPGNVEALTQKQSLLSQQIEVTSQKLSQLKEAEQQVQEQFQRGDITEEQYRAFRREVEFTQGSLDRLKQSLIDLDQEQQRSAQYTKQLDTLFQATGTSIDDYAQTLDIRLVNAIKSGTANSKQLDDAISKISQEALGAKVDIEKVKTALDSIDDGKSAENVRQELQKLSKEADDTRQKFKELDIDLENVLGAAMAGGGIEGAVEKSLDLSSLNTKIDITFDVPESSKKSVYDAVKIIESYGVDGEAALEGVRRQWALNKNISDETNASVVKGAAVIASAYDGIDFTELIQETNEIASGLKISNQDALGLVNSLLKAGFPPDQLDIISEYGEQLQRAGFNAEQIQAIFAAGIDTKTWNIDNLMDGLKEGRIRLAEFGQAVPQATAQLLKNTDISTKQLQTWGQQVAAGGAQGQKAMAEVAHALSNVKDKTTQNALGVQIFGTMWEDQGSNILSTLIGAQKQTVNLKANQDQLNDSVSKMNANPAIQMKQAITELQLAMTPLLTVIASIISAIAGWIREHPQLAAAITAVVTAIGILVGLCMALAPVFITLSSAATMLGASVAAIATPILLIIAAIGALVAIGTALYKNWDSIREYAATVWAAILGVIQPAVEAIKSFILNEFGAVKEWWMEIWPDLKQAFENIWNGIKTFIETLINQIVAIFKWAWPYIQQIIQTVWGVIKTVIESALRIIMDIISAFAMLFTGNWSSLWNNIKDILSAIWDVIKSVIGGALNIIQTIISAAWNVISSVTSTVWNGIKAFFDGIWNGIQKGVGKFKEAFLKTWDGIKAGIKSVINPIIGFINGLISGLESMINGLASAINSIPKFHVPDWVPGIGGKDFGLPTIGMISLPRIPSLDVGTNYVKRGGLAYLHEGEAVVPKKYNPAAGGKQEQNININIYSPKPLDPYETSRLTRNALKEMAMQV